MIASFCPSFVGRTLAIPGGVSGGHVTGEPVFIVKGSDVVAGDTVRAWASLAAKAGTPAEVLELALQQADAMDRWGHKKKPLGPDLTENERLQLRVQHGRRAWQAREGVADTYPLLADKLAQDCISGILRPILAELLAGQTVDWDTAKVDPSIERLFALAGWNAISRIEATRTTD